MAEEKLEKFAEKLALYENSLSLLKKDHAELAKKVKAQEGKLNQLEREYKKVAQELEKLREIQKELMTKLSKSAVIEDETSLVKDGQDYLLEAIDNGKTEIAEKINVRLREILDGKKTSWERRQQYLKKTRISRQRVLEKLERRFDELGSLGPVWSELFENLKKLERENQL
jgi:chromosome segregation ATPase